MEGSSDADWKLIGIDRERIAEVIPIVHEWLVQIEALTDGDLLIEDCVSQLISGEKQLWLVVKEKIVACVITEVVTNRLMKYAVVLVCYGGGNAMRWTRTVITHLENWARENGCQKTKIYGRKAWLRLLPDYKVTRYVLEKELYEQ